MSWFTMQIRRRQTPFGRVLAFGDGMGMAVEAAVVRKDTSEIIYFNISREECRRFLKLLDENRLEVAARCMIGDANTFDFRSLGIFDTIISVGAFHHMKKFDRIFSQLNQILAPDGLIYVDEFVGPRKLRFGGHVCDRINEQLSVLPDTLVLNRKRVKPWEFFLFWLRGEDPSEAVCSDRLAAAIERNFEVAESEHFGGSFLFPFFLTSCLHPRRLHIPNWHMTSEGAAELQRLVRLENQLIDSGVLSKDYVYYVLRKR